MDYVRSASESVRETCKDLGSYSSEVFSDWKAKKFDLRRRERVSCEVEKIGKDEVLSFLCQEHKRIVGYSMHKDRIVGCPSE